MTRADDQTPPIRWDRARQEDLSSSLVAARAQGDAVVIDFGDRISGGEQGEVLTPVLKRRIAMPPITAKRLLDILVRLAAEDGVRLDGAG